MSDLVGALVTHLNYYGFIALALIGFYGMATRAHLVRQLIGLTVFQTSIIMLFVSTGAKWGADLPIATGGEVPDAAAHMNPLPHALMLTAIVVSVATQGVAMALLIRVRRQLGTLDDDAVEAELQRQEQSADCDEQ